MKRLQPLLCVGEAEFAAYMHAHLASCTHRSKFPASTRSIQLLCSDLFMLGVVPGLMQSRQGPAAFMSTADRGGENACYLTL